MPKVLLTVPPLWIIIAPVLEAPTLRPVDRAPAAPTTAGLGVTVSILVLVELVGTPADQLPALNQSVETAPVHCSRARDGVVVAKTTPSATTDAAKPRHTREFKKIAMRALVTAQLPQPRRNAIRVN